MSDYHTKTNEEVICSQKFGFRIMGKADLGVITIRIFLLVFTIKVYKSEALYMLFYLYFS